MSKFKQKEFSFENVTQLTIYTFFIGELSVAFKAPKDTMFFFNVVLFIFSKKKKTVEFIFKII
jgi:hypothetical protein